VATLEEPTRATETATMTMMEPPLTTITDPPSPASNADPTAVRPALAQLAADNLSELQRSVLEAALSATRPVWMTFTCGSCGTSSRVEAPVPDTRARLQAVELLLREGLGRPAQVDEPHLPALPTTAARIRELGWDDLVALATALQLDDIETTITTGGVEALRARVARLTSDQRQMLRDALTDAAVG
jgi:hypothetical protein